MILAGSSAEPMEVDETGEIHLDLKSPVVGIVSTVDILPGQTVTAGQKLMTIVDPSIVWLRVNLFERDYYRMGAPHGATVTIPGLETPLLIEREGLKYLSKGDLFDSTSRTIPVIFETENDDELLKVGQIVQLEIYTSEETESVAVPETSIIDEDYGKYVFVQEGGESFEKRAVETGARSRGLIAILEGLAVGERVVTVGAYRVKLASTTKEVGHPHVH
jgi:RND family efflux transporter MFP subunit